MNSVRNVILLAVALAACGGSPSAQSICIDSCDKQASCNNASTLDRTTCENDCANDTDTQDQVQMAKDNCKNSDDVINAADDCVKKYCGAGDVASCLSTAIGTCQAK